MRPSPAFDPRQRYRADFDDACARGFVDPDQVARGVNPAWFRYLHCAEMCERPSEEWELGHASTVQFFGPVRIALRSLEHLKTVIVGDQAINAEALRRLVNVNRRQARSGWWPDVVRFLGSMQIDVAWIQDRAELELRPTRHLGGRFA